LFKGPWPISESNKPKLAPQSGLSDACQLLDSCSLRGGRVGHAPVRLHHGSSVSSPLPCVRTSLGMVEQLSDRPSSSPAPPSVPFRSFSRASSSFRSSSPRPPLPSGGASPNRGYALSPSRPRASPPLPHHAPSPTRARRATSRRQRHRPLQPPPCLLARVARGPRTVAGHAAGGHRCALPSRSSRAAPPPPVSRRPIFPLAGARFPPPSIPVLAVGR
jgi:hypothetical protein